MATGAYAYRDQYYGQRLILDLSRSGNTINYSLRMQSTGSYMASTPWSLSGNHSASGTANVSLGSAGTVTLATGSFSRSAATTVSASASLFWGGTATVSASIGAAGSPPGAPTNVTYVRTGDRSLTMTFTIGSGGTSTRVQYRYAGETAWRTTSSTTGTSIGMSGLALNNAVYLRAYSTNAVGNSSYGVSDPPIFYTPPRTPSRPLVTVSNNQVHLSFTDASHYKLGFEVERSSDNQIFSVGTGTSASGNTWVDESPIGTDLQYRVRRFAGAAGANTRVFGGWSDWSTPVTAIPAPQITRFTAERCDSTGALNPLGTYLRVISSGTVADVADNQFLRRFRRRPVGGAWGGWVTDGQNLAATSWTNRALTLFSGSLVTTAYDLQMEVVDSFTSTSHTVQVPTGETAMSLSRTGVGVGKIWEQGALDVGGAAHISGDSHIGGAAHIGGDVFVEGSLHLADPNEIIIDGVAYQRSGYWSIGTTGAWLGTQPVFYRTGTFRLPYTPPTGWKVIVGVTQSSGYTFADVGGADGDIITIRMLQIASSSTTAISRISWTLVKDS